MKSKIEQLRKRGYIDDLDLSTYHHCPSEALYDMLKSREAYKRTIAIRVLYDKVGMQECYVEQLLSLAIKEQALYTKIEIGKVLSLGDQKTCLKMVLYLGKIGNNQHHKLPNKVSQKKSYPLPRDFIARSLGNSNPQNLSILFNVLTSNDLDCISEVLDAIGFLIFYHSDYATIENLQLIINVIEQYHDQDVIVWKAIQSLSAFPKEETIRYLSAFAHQPHHPTILMEVDRSLAIIHRKLAQKKN